MIASILLFLGGALTRIGIKTLLELKYLNESKSILDESNKILLETKENLDKSEKHLKMSLPDCDRCGKPAYFICDRGCILCKEHYKEHKKHGTPEAEMSPL